MISPIRTGGRQFLANYPYGCNNYYDSRGFSCTKESFGTESNNVFPGHTLHRYPSLDRPAYSPSRPVTSFCRSLRKGAVDIGYHGNSAMNASVDCATIGAARTLTEGRQQCRRKQFFSPQWRCSVWQGASRAISNVVWLAQAQVWSRLKSWAPIQQGPRLPVPQLASCVTTQACAVRPADTRNIALSGGNIFESRHRGQRPGGGFSV